MHCSKVLLVIVSLLPPVAHRAVGADGAPTANADFPNTAHFRGRVVDEQGKPLKGVKVWPHEFHGKLAPPRGTLAETFAEVTGVTDENGRFSIPLHFAGGQLAVSKIAARTIGNFAQLATTRDSGFAYLAVFELAATPEETEKLLTAMRTLRDAPGFIVDLRRCSGGSEPLAQQIAQFFCDRELVYAKNKYRNGPRHDDFGPDLDRTLSPSNEPYTKAVVCLIGNRTMSSAESFAQMLAALPHVVTIGGRTRGSSGNPAPVALPEIDVTVGYSRWFDMNSDGSPVEGHGVMPDILVERPVDAYRDSDPIFLKTIAELGSRTESK